MAHHFHPDKNHGNNFASEYFFEIQEAYEILSHESSRRAYDKERRLSGAGTARQPVSTPQELLRQVQILASDVNRMNLYRIDTPWLKSAISRQLAVQNIALLSEPGLKPLRNAFLKELTRAINMLPYPFPEDIQAPMQVLSSLDTDSLTFWENFMKAKKRKYIFQKWLPWIGAATTLALCLLMYWYGKRW